MLNLVLGVGVFSLLPNESKSLPTAIAAKTAMKITRMSNLGGMILDRLFQVRSRRLGLALEIQVLI